MGDEIFRNYLKDQKSRWGNYQGICPESLAEMQKNFPNAYQEFLAKEKALEAFVNGDTSN